MLYKDILVIYQCSWLFELFSRVTGSARSSLVVDIGLGIIFGLEKEKYGHGIGLLTCLTMNSSMLTRRSRLKNPVLLGICSVTTGVLNSRCVRLYSNTWFLMVLCHLLFCFLSLSLFSLLFKPSI
jgi:hypothetical protein